MDTSALIAFTDRSDTWHSLFVHLFEEPPTLVTSALVVVEGHGWFLRRYDRQRAMQFLALIERLPISIQPFDNKELLRAREVLVRFSDQNLTLADAHGLSIMRLRDVETCWSTDRHMGLTGVRLAINS